LWCKGTKLIENGGWKIENFINWTTFGSKPKDLSQFKESKDTEHPVRDVSLGRKK